MDYIHLILDITTPLVGIVFAYIMLLIRSEQAKSHAELLAYQTKVKEDLVETANATTRELAVHTAEDAQRFSNIDKNFADLKKSIELLTERIIFKGRENH